MASTSTSSVQKSFKYDVFLSFRGEDTRKTFVDHLYHALQQRDIITYKDDERIEKGERIDDQLSKSIQDSRYHIIVFSKNYASSSWCLDELVKIMECQKTKEQTAYPIFYDVEPTEVRNQTGAVGLAFAKHEKCSQSSVTPLVRLFSFIAYCCSGSSSLSEFTRLSEMEEDIRRWRRALKDAASLAGMELKNTLDGHEARFIKQVVEYISLKLPLIGLNADEKLVGMKTRVNSILSSLEINCDDDVRMVGIKGIGGGGKTTLARVVFDVLSSKFEGKSFVENVREVSKSSLSGLAKLQKQVLKDVLRESNIDIHSVSDGKNMMRKRMPSRKVLLVLDDVDDTKQLEALAGASSWFKLGSRIIVTTRDEQVLAAHKVNFAVNFTHDVNLLTGEEAICLLSKYAFGGEIPNQEYKQLSREIVHYAQGLPLTIKVLGSDLCGRTKLEWEDTIRRLKTIPEEQTLERLELSYIGLKNDQKEIFLDIVCILKGERKGKAIQILESCGYYAGIGLKVLEAKSLINVSFDDRLLMHDLIEEMGRNIVRRIHPDEPKRHSRLWIKEEIEDILVTKSGTKATRSIYLKYMDLHPAIIIQGLRNMTNLRLLYLDDEFGYRREIDEVIGYLPNTLRSLYWSGYNFWCLPKTFQETKLIKHEINNNSNQLWERSIKTKLVTCVMNEVGSITCIPQLLEEAKTKLVNPMMNKIGYTPQLLKGLKIKETTPVNLEIHDDFDILQLLDEAKRKETKVVSLERNYYNGITKFLEGETRMDLKYLNILHLSSLEMRTFDLGMFPTLERLSLEECRSLEELHIPVVCPKLKSLKLGYSKLRNLNLKMTPNLTRLHLVGCDEFVELNMPVELSKLKILELSCSMLRNLNLVSAPCLEKLNLEECSEFAKLDMPIEYPKLKFLNLRGSKVSNLNLGRTPNLNALILEGCNDFVELQVPVECPKLKILNLSGFKVSNLKPVLTPLLEKSESLEVLTLSFGDIKRLPDGIWKFTQLKRLDLACCRLLDQLPADLDRLECLEELDLGGCSSLRDIPNSICKMKRLKMLDLTCCSLLEKLPEDFGRLESLGTLHIEGAGIKSLPQSIFQLKDLSITGSRCQLESYGFTSLVNSRHASVCYIRDNLDL